MPIGLQRPSVQALRRCRSSWQDLWQVLSGYGRCGSYSNKPDRTITSGLPTVRELRSGLQELGMQTDAAFTVGSFIRPNNVRRLFSSPSLTPEGSGHIVLRRDNAEIRSCCYVRSASSPSRKVSLHRCRTLIPLIDDSSRPVKSILRAMAAEVGLYLGTLIVVP